MPSSTSSSDTLVDAPERYARQSVPDSYARQTAADRPGVAQPVPLRPVPVQPWGRILIGVVVLLVLLVAGWEEYWRAYGVRPSIANTYGLWAIQRRRIDAGEGDATVLAGASRLYFDIQLPVWERLDGRRPSGSRSISSAMAPAGKMRSKLQVFTQATQSAMGSEPGWVTRANRTY